jgi:hypothetical protein
MSQSFSITRPDVLLRVEGLIVLVSACLVYCHVYSGKWWIFALLFLAPDISLFGYIGGSNPKAARPLAAIFYNLLHCYVLPLALGLLAWKFDSAWGGMIALIWISHIGLDRFLGFGLKFAGSFKHTHIQSSATL